MPRGTESGDLFSALHGRKGAKHTIGMERVLVLKQLSSTNWEFERDHCTEILSN